MASISLNDARQIIHGTFAKGQELNLRPLAVVVLDDGGHPIAFERQNGCSPGRFKVAEGKAYGCVMMGMGGEAFSRRAETHAHFVLALNGAYDGKLVPVPGGILVRSKAGEVVGAIGVTGDTSENDAAAGRAGVEAAGLIAET